MIWTNKYTNPGVPFVYGGRTMNGCDCSGLVLLVLKQELGINALDFNNYCKNDFNGITGMRHLSNLIDKAMTEWGVVSGDPKEFDLVRMRVGSAKCHVGIFVGQGYFLHIEDNPGSIAKLTHVSSIDWGKRIFEYRRRPELA